MKLKLLRTVGIWREIAEPEEHPFFPPLAMGIIYQQLKKHGYDVSQDDLSIRFHHAYHDADGKNYQPGLFFQEEGIRRYALTGVDAELEQEMEKILDGTHIAGIDVFLLSIPESLYNAENILFAVALAKFLKKKYSAWIVIGGHPFSVGLLAEKYDVSGFVDYIVRNDGEEAVLVVLEKISRAGSAKAAGKAESVEISSNEIVVPDFSGLPLEKYRLSFLRRSDFFSHQVLNELFASQMLVLPFRFTKGCPNSCAFCNSSSDGLRSFLSPEEVFNGLKFLQERFNPTGYFFLNDTINIRKEYIEKICNLIIENGLRISWSDCASPAGLDEEVISRMRASGCIRLVLGMETASPRLLKRIRKGITTDRLEAVLRLADKYGIWTGVEIICGLPHETEEDVSLTVDFLSRNAEYIDRAYCNIFDLRPRSLMYLQPQDYGIENIKPAGLYAVKDGEDFNSCNFVEFSFDETGGLKWADKKRQMVDSYRRITEATRQFAYLPLFLEEHILFYLYSRFQKKDLVKRYYLEVAEAFHKRNSGDPLQAAAQ